MNILSLFDGMACGMLAMLRAGVKVDSYYAYEIDKYAVQTATHNFPEIVECGDVFQADFTKYHDIDFIVGGSPCTYWSIAQKNGRETTASGLGWELFSQYVRALRTVKPKYFIYENNKSMSNAIRESISETFDFEPICINSALVSAQNRQRLYWVGRRNEGGDYDKVNVQYPKDRGILLRDILDGAEDLTSKSKSWALTATYDGACPQNTIERSQRNMCVEPVGTTADNKAFCLTSYYSTGQNAPHTLEKHIGSMVAVPVGETKDSKSYCLTAGYSNGSGENIGNYAAHTLEKGCKSMVAVPVNATKNGKSQTIKAQSQMTSIANIVKYKSTYGASGVAEPVCVAQRGRYADTGSRSHKTSAPIQQYYEPRQDGKTNTLTTVQKDNAVCETVRVGSMPRPNGELSQSQGMRVYSADGKSVNLLGNAGGAGAKTGLYAIPVEFKDGIPTKAISNSDGKAYIVYRVTNGIIQIKDKEYPIKLQDGFYIIRKLSVSECKRLQTVPEWYEFPVSNARAYKMLGNGWTVDVIAHLIKACLEPDTEFVPKQLSFF